MVSTPSTSTGKSTDRIIEPTNPLPPVLTWIFCPEGSVTSLGIQLVPVTWVAGIWSSGATPGRHGACDGSE